MHTQHPATPAEATGHGTAAACEAPLFYPRLLALLEPCQASPRLALRRQVRRLLRAQGPREQALRCLAIEGVDIVTAALLAGAYGQGEFKSAGAYIAFVNSGRSSPLREAPLHGQTHHLLLTAARTARRSVAWRERYQLCRRHGRTETQALKGLARHLARVAFSLMETRGDYLPGGRISRSRHPAPAN